MIRYLEAGESHGKGLVAIIEGLPAGISIDIAFINQQLARRQGGHGRGGRMKIRKGQGGSADRGAQWENAGLSGYVDDSQ